MLLVIIHIARKS